MGRIEIKKGRERRKREGRRGKDGYKEKREMEMTGRKKRGKNE